MNYSPDPHYRHRFPAELISHAVWPYHVFSLSFRDAELILAERGVILAYESIRRWCLKDLRIDAVGRVENPAFRHYQVPAWADLPRTEVLFADTTDSVGPFGAKSTRESPLNPRDGSGFLRQPRQSRNNWTLARPSWRVPPLPNLQTPPKRLSRNRETSSS
jgi:hypothetical protein